MFGSYEGAMVDRAAAPQIGSRTLCQHPGCGRPIELIPPMPPDDDHPVWAHVVLSTWAEPDHEPTPVEPEYPGEKLIGSVKASYDRHLRQQGRREGLTDLAAQLRELAEDGMDEFAAGLRHAAREAERCAGGGQ